MTQSEQRFLKTSTLISRQIAGETILVPLYQPTGQSSRIFTLNDTASRTWELLDGQHTLSEIHAYLLEEYEVEPDQARADLWELIGNLREIGAIQEA
jgi:hypothetical protein